jgi:hypothetical protein
LAEVFTPKTSVKVFPAVREAARNELRVIEDTDEEETLRAVVVVDVDTVALVIVGEVERTTDPNEPVVVVVIGIVGVVHTFIVALDTRICPDVPMVIRPVPPEVVGIAVPEYVTAKVPVVVIGDPVTVNAEGTVIATDDKGVTHEATVPFDCSMVPFEPIEVKPVPPFAIGSAVPE